MRNRNCHIFNRAAEMRRLNSIYFVRSTLKLSVLACVLLSGFAHAADDGKWYRQMASSFRGLYGAVVAAERGDPEGMFSAGAWFMRGTGSREGSKPDAALQYMQKAASSGHRDAMLFSAVLYSLKEKNIESKNVTGMLEKYRKAEPAALAPEYKNCGDSQSCADYYQLLSGYFQLMLEYPRQARYEGRETRRRAAVDFENRTVTVEGAADDFTDVVVKAMKNAIDQVPEPDGFSRKGRKDVFPVSFKLTE